MCREVLIANWTLTDVNNDRLDFSKTGLPERQPVYDRYADAELEWYRSGNLEAKSAPSKFWLKIADSDGNIVSNYGHMILCDRQYPGRQTAADHVVRLLREDPDSRQAILHYNLPRHYQPGSKDIPCTLTAQLLCRSNRLSMWVTQRSCDAIKGLSFDVPWHCYLLRELAAELGVVADKLHHTIGSLHLYETDIEMARKIIADPLS